MMNLVIDYDGKRYISKKENVEKENVINMANSLLQNIDNLSKLQVEIEGGYLILGPEAIRRCVIMVME